MNHESSMNLTEIELNVMLPFELQEFICVSMYHMSINSFMLTKDNSNLHIYQIFATPQVRTNARTLIGVEAQAQLSRMSMRIGVD